MARIAVAVLLTALALAGIALAPRTSTPTPPTTPAEPTLPRTAGEILAERERLDRTVWAQEIEAQRYEEPFIALWDGMRARLDDQHRLLAEFPVGALSLRSFGAEEAHRWGIVTAAMAGAARRLDQAQWRGLVLGLAGQGYRLEHSEWHHAAFSRGADGVARSTVTCKLFIRHGDRRIVIAGPLAVTWSDRLDDHGRHLPTAIDATGLALTARAGEDAFTEAWTFRPLEAGVPDAALDPVLLYDLDGDGRDDLVLPSLNLVQWNRSRPGEIAFAPATLCEHPSWSTAGESITAAVLADVTGDGIVDLVVAGPRLPPQLLAGLAGGRFRDPVPATTLPPGDIVDPMVITAGDVDGDGRIDLWLGQYRKPFVGGNLPTPYWDARDGHPSYLLLNRGGGRFSDATVAWGLEAKRTRRTYSASFVDLDGDGRLDLMTVNDFAGLDLWRNAGGRFVDASEELADHRSAFGMSHAIADLDGDGRLDLFVAGMGSTTARRLERMGVGRPEFPQHQAMRMPMGYGNRLLLGGADGRYRQAGFNDQVARTGWSWGCAAFDAGNDGRLDLFVANGHLSRRTAKDYCSRYWTQDIYTPGRPGDDELASVFRSEMDRTAGISWNGFEHKALLLNEGGGFRDVAYACDLAFEWDGRAVLADDLDGDGAVDLLVEELRTPPDSTLPTRSVLHALRNHLGAGNHWLEVRVPDAPGRSPQGVRIVVRAGGRDFPAAIVSGDSYRSQHPPSAHVGLGAIDRADEVRVRWSDGHEAVVERPPVDRVLIVRP